MNVLVTGGAGFIGSHLVKKLYQLGHNITVVDNLSEQIHTSNPEISPLYLSIKDKVKFIRGSVNDLDIMIKALRNQNIIFHLAAETGTGQSMYEVDKYVSTNIGATSQILDFLGQESHECSRFIIASSRSIYGEGKYEDKDGSSCYPPHRSLKSLENGIFEITNTDGSPMKLLPTSEDSMIHPSSVYGITKQVQEQLVMTVCPLLEIEPVALRFQNVFGPGQSLTNPYTGILSIFSNLIMNGQEINIFEDGLESRDFVYIDDVVNSLILAAESSKAAGGIFNVGSGVPTTVKTVAESLIKLFDKDIPIKVSGNFRLGDIRHNFACLNSINSELGFKPSISFEEGLSKFVEWAKKIGPSDSGYAESLAEMKSKGLFK